MSGGDSTLINHQNDNNDDNDRTVPVQVSHDDLLTTSMVDEKEEVEAEEETVVVVMAPKAKRVKKPRKMKGMFPRVSLSHIISFPHCCVSSHFMVRWYCICAFGNAMWKDPKDPNAPKVSEYSIIMTYHPSNCAHDTIPPDTSNIMLHIVHIDTLQPLHSYPHPTTTTTQ